MRDLREIQKRVSQEIAARGRSERARELHIRDAEDNATQILKDEAAEEEKSRQIKQNRQKQREVLNKQLSESRWGYIMAAEIAKASAISNGEWQPQTYKNSQLPMQDDQEEVEESDDDDPFAESPIERVHGVFPKDNKRNSPRPWTAQDRRQFIDIMKYQRGKDRYEIAAERLNCSMDSIFQLAKELQELMDEIHQNGEWNEPCDEWTYDIWVERRDSLSELGVSPQA